jgi:hypothetical protein
MILHSRLVALGKSAEAVACAEDAAGRAVTDLGKVALLGHLPLSLERSPPALLPGCGPILSIPRGWVGWQALLLALAGQFEAAQAALEAAGQSGDPQVVDATCLRPLVLPSGIMSLSLLPSLVGS